MIRLLVLLLLFSFTGSPASAQLEFAGIFGDNMVLQRGEELAIWGTAPKGAEVAVELKGNSYTAVASDDGRWEIKANPIKVGDPFEVTASCGDEKIVLRNCVAGEVWICSGQSNMEWRVQNSRDPEKEIAAADFPMIRHFEVSNKTAFREQDKVDGSGWSICSSDTAGSYTAVGYFFARNLHTELNVPIGLVNTTLGGTIVEAWTSPQSVSQVDEFAAKVDRMQKLSRDESANKKLESEVLAWQTNIQKAIQDDSHSWQTTETDDSSWKEIKVPSHWESRGFADVDGVIWYRKKVKIPDAWVGKPLQLSLGMIDDRDKTWVNGTLVGGMDMWNEERSYEVPGEAVKSSQVQVAVRVADGGMGGGIYGGQQTLCLKSDDASPISLVGDWKAKPTPLTEQAGPAPKVAYAGPNHPTKLYNAMVHPLVPLTFKGAIWYQGESNTGRAYQYRTLFPLLIKDWRGKWKKDFPFYWVQLANFQQAPAQPGPSSWAELREAQSMTLSLPNTGQAVIIDIGEANDIHPRNKQDVGLRLAKIALKKDYGKDGEFSGPVFKSMNISGSKAILSFEHADGLMAKDGPLKRFEIAGADKKFVWANATVEGNTVIVQADSVSAPVAVRYAWADNPQGCNLYNSAGLPASPFRTDDWKGVTRNE